MRGSWFDRTTIHEPRPYSPMTRDRRPGIITSTATIVLLALCLPGAAQSHNVREGTVTTDDGMRLYYRQVGTGQDFWSCPLPCGFHRTSTRWPRATDASSITTLAAAAVRTAATLRACRSIAPPVISRRFAASSPSSR